MNVLPGSEDVSVIIPLVDPTTNGPNTGITINTLEMAYTRRGAATQTSGATALATVATGHTDNYAFEQSATNAPGDYRFDFPDAAFAAGVDQVQLTVLDGNGVVIGRLAVSLAQVDIGAINGDLTDGTPAVADRPILHLQQLNAHCNITGEGAMQLVNDHAGGAGLAVAGENMDVYLNGSGVMLNASGKPVAVNTASILGTELTETTPGYLAAAFTKLFDVETPLLVASDVMRGTDDANTTAPNTTVPDVAGTAATLVGNLNDFDGTGATLADGAITAAKIGADAITNAKIADDAIRAENLATNAISADAIKADAVTKMQDGLATIDETIWYVATDGDNGNGGHSWDDALATLEYAAETAGTEGDTFYVGSGTWGLETIDNAAAVNKGDGTVGIPVTSHGFEAAETIRIDGSTYFTGGWLIDSVSANEVVIVTDQDTIDNAVAVNLADGEVEIPTTNTSIGTGDHVTISGTSHYDGEYTVVLQSADGDGIVITSEFTAETFGGTETITQFRAETFAGTETMANSRSITLQAGQRIIGISPNDTKIYGGSGYFNTGVINAAAGGIRLEYLQVYNTASTNGMGVVAMSGHDLDVSHCVIYGSVDGLWGQGADRVTVRFSDLRSLYDSCLLNGEACLVEDSVLVSSGMGQTGSEAGAFRTSLDSGTSANCSVTLRRTVLAVERTTAEDHFASAIEADGNAVVNLENCQMVAGSTHADDTGDMHGVLAKGASKVHISGGAVSTSTVGSGDEYKLVQEETATLRVVGDGCDLGSNETAGTITTETATQIAVIEADTNDLQANQGNWATAEGFSTFNASSDTVTTDDNSRTASQATGFSTHNAAAVKMAVEAEGSTLADIKTKTDTTLARLGAWTGTARNTILGAMQALFRKDTNASVPSDINADLGDGEGAANNVTDSTEGIADSSATGGATAEEVWAYEARTITGGGTSYVLPAVSSPTTSGRIATTNLTAYQYATIQTTLIILDTDDAAIDLSEKVVAFVAWDKDTPAAALIEMQSDGDSPELTIGGDDNNEVTIDGSATHTATAQQLDWRLVNTTDLVDVGRGVLKIEEGGPLPT